GQATCPNCGDLKSYGSAGVKNLVKRHLNTTTCRAIRLKRDKQTQRRPNGLMTSYFSKQTAPVLVPSTVQAPAMVGHSSAFDITGSITPEPLPARVTPEAAPPPASVSSTRMYQLLEQLHANVALLPSTVPVADESHPFAILSWEPMTYVRKEIPAGELWEKLGAFFQSAFDYGVGLDERVRLVQRGPYGLDGALRFLEYFICERGLNEATLVLKIEQLVEAVQAVLQRSAISGPSVGELPSDQRVREAIIVGNEVEILKPVPVENPAPAPPTATISTTLCAGFIFPFSGPGKTTSSDYPYGLHDALSLPWTFSSNIDGTLTLRSTVCKKTSPAGRSSCRACSDLPKQPTLDGILERAKHGVKENASYAYQPISGLIELLRRKNGRIEDLRLRGFRAARRLVVQARSLSEHTRFLRAIGSGAVENVERLVRVELGRNQGIRGIISTFDKAAQGFHRTKSYTEADDLRGVLLWKMGGNRIADFAHRALGLPSRTTLRKRTTVPLIIASPGRPKESEVAQNVAACFGGITDVLEERKPKHVVLMYDEIATEKRIRWDPKTNFFLGVCREHAQKVSLQFNSEQDLEELFRGLSKEVGDVHFAGEATVAALGMISDHTRLYAARPVLLSGDCKKESGVEHVHNVLHPTIAGVNSKRDLTGLRIISLASDGESRRGKAFVEMTFVRKISRESNIYELLQDLELMNFWVGEDDLTGDKDYKHVFKRARNRLIRLLGMQIFGFQITPTVIRVHLQHAGLSTDHINSILRPEDKQDVKLAFELLKDIWSLPVAPEGSRPGFVTARNALRLVGSLYYHLLFPYLCVDLTLSEQLEHLSAAAHLLLILYRDGQKAALPTLLYTDIMIMIKNVYFCVAKAKVDDPTGNFWIILLGTDRLEELFGILRTMIGNDRNLDMLQLEERITGTTEVANIFALYPQWDRAPSRLRIPTMARDSTVLPDRADHIKPPSWRGDTSVQAVTPLTCWNRGRRMAEGEHPSLANHFLALNDAFNVDILSPLGEALVFKLDELDADDNENDDEDTSSEAVATSSVPIDLEDAAADEDVLDVPDPTFTSFITVKNQPLRKTRALSLMQKFGYKAGSTDRLKRVADVQRYSSRQDDHNGIIESDTPYILLSEPIATLIRSEGKLFVAIGEVTDLGLDSKSVEQLGVDVLRERKVTVHFQILRLIPATTEDDPSLKHDWRSGGLIRNVLITAGRLVVPMDPALTTRTAGTVHYLFDSTVLRALGAQLLDEVTLQLNKTIPKFAPTSHFPYRESSGSFGVLFAAQVLELIF
ncbi:hypothetical protein B0H17DRAFT_957128, partial [Mycena rosella]